MEEINCLVIEDEPLAARVVADYITQTPGLRLAGVCEDVFSARKKMDEEKIGLLLLDINLPGINGIDFIRTLAYKCHIILTTAYQEYAVAGFELDVIDYLLKPITSERFEKAIHKVQEYEQLLHNTTDDKGGHPGHIFIKSDGMMLKVFFDEILYVESVQNYVLIYTTGRKLITYSTLKNIEQLLPATRFVKVQKSFIVALDKISSLKGNEITIGDATIAISRKLKEEIRNKILS